MSQEPRAGELARAPIEGRVLDGPVWEVIPWPDLDYLARVKTVDASMEFEVYTVVSWGSTSYASGMPVESDAPIFELAEWHASGDNTEDIAEAAPLFHGRVKWDGCSDWDWTAAKLMWHGCAPRDVADLTEAMRRTYALAAERIDHWDPM